MSLILGLLGGLPVHLLPVSTRVDDVPKELPESIAVNTAQELQQALDASVYGTIITLGADIWLTSPLRLNKTGVAILLRSSGGTRTLTAPFTRHLDCRGSSIDLFFDGIVLDGGGTGGGIVSGVSGLSVSGVTIQNCYSSSGGGIEAVSGALQIEEGTVIKGNRAAAYGGGVATGAGVNLQIDGGELSGNTAGAYGGGVFGGVGCTIGMDGGQVHSNRSILGGGVYCGVGGKLVLNDGAIHSNEASGVSAGSGLGGGIFAVTADLILDGVTIADNRAYHGGGIYATGDGSDVILHSGSISGNSAMGANACGGGVFLDTAYSVVNTCTINSGVVGTNQAVRGGGVYAGGSQPPAATSSPGSRIPASVTLNSGDIASNTAAYGGGICGEPGTKVEIGGGTVTGNGAEVGGGIWIEPLENVTVDSEGSFAGNRASAAVYVPTREHIALHQRNIRTTTFTDGFSYAYNNYDICYEGQGETPQYTVTFDYQDADGGNTENNRVIAHGEALGSLPRPNKAGHTLLGWFSDSEGGEQFTDSSVITGDLTLFARWQANTYTITFNYNGAQPPSQEFLDKEVTYGSNVGLLPIPVKSPQDVFAGWFDANGRHYFPASIYMVEGDLTLTAKWIPADTLQHIITFHYGTVEGTVIEESRTVSNGEELGQLPRPAWRGYQFDGWFDSDGNGPFESATEMWDDLNLYARWTRLPWTVGLDYQGADPGDLPNRLSVEDNQTIPELPSPTRDGYQFQGWFTSPEDGTQVTQTTPITQSLTLYARWEANTHYLYFDYQGGFLENSPSKKEIQYGQKVGALPLPVKSGNVFTGWYSQPENGGLYLGGSTSGRVFDHSQDLTIFAGWNGDRYTITFDYQGADSSGYPQSKDVQYENNIGYLPFPQREDYRFAGWFTAPDGQGQQVFVGTQYAIAGSITLYAHWIPEGGQQLGTVSRGPLQGTPNTPSGQYPSTLPEAQEPDLQNPNTGRPTAARVWHWLGLGALAVAAWLSRKNRKQP